MSELQMNSSSVEEKAVKETPVHQRTSLEGLQIGIEAQILGFDELLPAHYLSRLCELGFREGEWVRCLRHPPLGAPRVFQVDGAVFSLETSVARLVWIRP